MDTQSRLIEFIHSKKISISDFERISNLSTGYVHKIKNSVGKRALGDIQRAFPDLNSNWLLTGEGEMLNPSFVQNNQNGDNIHGQSVTVNKTETDYIAIIKMQSEQLSKSQEQIDRLLTLLERK